MKKSDVSNLDYQKVKDLFQIYLSKIIKKYELRDEQVRMSFEIYKSFVYNQKIIVEAPTGVGKSLAYLIALILYKQLNNSKSRIIVSTYTKTLQNQLFDKELKVLSRLSKMVFNKKLTYTCFFGSENYICLFRYHDFINNISFSEDNHKINMLHDWLRETKTGLLEEFGTTLSFWQDINRQADLCSSKKCKYYSICFYYKNLRDVKLSDIVVINHHLFFANIVSTGNLLPKQDEYEDLVVFDEAHNIEEVALQWLGGEISKSQIKYLMRQIYNSKTQKGIISKLDFLSDKLKDTLINLINDVNASCGQFFSELSVYLKDKKELRVYQQNIVQDVITSYLIELHQILKSLINMSDNDEQNFKLNAFANRVLSVISILKFWLKANDNSFIYWVEKVDQKKDQNIILHITPIDIAKEMQEKIFSKYEKIVFTSATIAVGNEFSYFKKSVGLLPQIVDFNEVKTLILPHLFNYEENVILYLPENISDPNSEKEKYINDCSREISKLLLLTKGNTFVLFTSFEMMNSVFRNIQKNNLLENISILAQGEVKHNLVEQFKKIRNSVLLGVDTFWQGVDIPGKKLISIIIPKLPFEVPVHPLIEAKIQKIRFEGGDPFVEYTLPEAIIKLRQGFGRLVRKKTDWGIVSILDPRVKKRWYGRHFLNSLPNCKKTTKFDEVVKFYESKCNSFK